MQNELLSVKSISIIILLICALLLLAAGRVRVHAEETDETEVVVAADDAADVEDTDAGIVDVEDAAKKAVNADATVDADATVEDTVNADAGIEDAVNVESAAEDTVADESADTVVVDHGLPVVYLNIDETQGTIDEMNTSPDHSAYCYGTLDISVPEGFHYSDFQDQTCESVSGLSMSIRGRGNSTWARFPKRPYKIKLDKKTDLFGLGKNKHWVLVANYVDHSLVKDRLTAWLGDKMNFEFTPRGVPVDVVITGTGVEGSEYTEGQYLGSYYLSENVRVDDNRLEIEELKESDTEEPTITGGYLVQNSMQVRQGSPDRFNTTRGIGWATHTPSFDTEADNRLLTGSEEEDDNRKHEEAFADPDPIADIIDPDTNQPFIDPETGEPELADAYENPVQQEYIQKHIQKVEDVLFQGGTAYHELMDVESAAKYWLINEVALNHDSYATGSTYIYKHRDVDGVESKIFWGPLWDYDFAWYYDETHEGFPIRHEWLFPMFCDKGEGGFVEEVKKQWTNTLKPALQEASRDGGILDGYFAETRESAEADQKIWREYETNFDYSDEIASFKTWIQNRIAWVDENIDSLDNMVHSIRFIADGSVFTDEFAKDGDSMIIPEETPVKEGYLFTGWFDENGQKVDTTTAVTRDYVLTAGFIAEGEATKAEDIVFQKSSDIQARGHYVSGYNIQYTVIPTDAQDQRVEWKSSDEAIAEINNKGEITYIGDTGTGDVTLTFTATLKSGKSRDFTLTLTDGDLPVPEAIQPERDSIEMTVGEQAGFSILTQPSPAFVQSYSYRSDAESVVTVDDNSGVLTAVGPGQTKVYVTTITPGDYPDPDIELETYMTVTVTDKETPDPDVKPDVKPVDISTASVAKIAKKVYTGSKIKPVPAVTLNGKTLVNNTDFELVYTNNKNVGTASIEIRGKGNYTGTKKVSFKIIPKATKLKSVKALKKGFRAKWKKGKGQITGYQLRWSRKADMSGAKKKRITSKKKLSYEKKKLKAGKKYYVQIRTYKMVKGVRYYSKWSKAKKVKTGK